jgi:hypothetical protein
VPVLADINGECTATATAPTTTDNCAGIVTGTTTDPLTWSTQGTHVIHWSFDDGHGNISQATQNVIVHDATAPDVPVLADVTGECTATATAPTTTDNCAGIVTGTTTDPLTWSTQGTHVIHWSFDDGHGNISHTTQNVIVDDVTAPDVPVLADVTGECTATATTPTATDNCSGTITGTTTDPLTYTAQGTHVIHWRFDDGHGNISQATQNVIVDDVSAPDVPVLANVTGECTATATAPTTTDNCSGTITGTTTDPLTYSTQGTHVIHWRFDDGNGNISQATQNVIIDDITAPDVPVLADLTDACTVTAVAPTTTDNCAGTVTGTTSDPLTWSTQGTHVIHWRFDDGNGNFSFADQHVIIHDVVAPVVPVLADINGECTATATAPTTTDNCAGIVTGTTTDPLTWSTQGTHVIHWSFDDGHGNISQATQNVIVHDATAPDVPVLADVTGECTATATAPTTTDNCAGIVTGTTTDQLTWSTQGTHVIHWSFDDGHGNISTAMQHVIIQDLTSPIVTTQAGVLNVTLECDDEAGLTAALAMAPTATDNCGGTPVMHLVNDVTTPDPACPHGYVRVRTWNFTDAGNNASSNFVQTITVQDHTPPFVIQMPEDVTVDANANCQATGVNLGILSAQDNCSAAVLITNDHPAVYPIGTTIVTWTIKDSCNNSITRQQTVRVVDHTNPVISNCPADITVFTGPGALTCSKAVSWTSPTASDNCGSLASFTSNFTPGAVFPVGNTLVTYTATDISTNSSTCSFNVNVVDNTVPVISNCPANIVTCNPNVTWTAPLASDNCGVTSFTNDAPASFQVGVTTVTYTARDAAGNTTTCSFTVTLNPAPSALAASNSPVCAGGTLSLSAGGGTAYSWTGPNGFSSNSQNPSIAFVTTAANGTYTVTVSNSAGCSATATTNVVVNTGVTATASSNSPVCSGSSLNLTASGGVSYSWTGPNGFVSLQQNPVINNATTAANGIYTVTVTNATGCTAQAFVSATVSAGINALASNNGPVCEGASLNLSAAGGSSYVWSGPNGFSSTLQNPSIPAVTLAASGTYTVTISSGGNCSATTTTNVTVNSIPTALAASNSPVCQGGTLNLSAGGGTSYAWTGPNGFNSLQQNPVISNVTPAAAGFYSATVTNTAGCSATTTIQVAINAATPASAASNSPVCAGNALNLFASAGASWSWSGPNGFSSLQQNPVLPGVTTAGTGIYTVTVTNASGCVSTASTNVTVGTAPVAGISSNSPVCEGSTLSLSASGGVSYNWTGPNGFASTQQNPVISNVTAVAGGLYTVTVTNAAACSASSSTNVTVNTGLVATASSNSPVCTGTTLSLFAGGGTSYNWSGPNGFASTQQNPTISGATIAASGIYTVTVTGAGGCTGSTTTSVAVNNGAVGGTVSGSAAVCAGNNSGTLNLSGQTGSVIRWESSTDNGVNWSNISNTTTSLTYTNLTQVTQYRAVVQVGSCAPANSSIATITMNPASVGGTVSGSTGVCSGSNSGSVTLSGQAGSVIRWESSTDNGVNWSTISNTTTTQSYTNLIQTTQYRAVVQNGSCTPANSDMATITVNVSSVGGTVSGSTSVCAGNNSGSLTLSGYAGAITKWQFSTNGGANWTDIANTTTSQSYSNLTQTTQYRAVIGGCATANSSIATITVSQASVGGSVSGSAAVCAGSNSGTLSLSGQTGDVIRWESSVDNGVNWSTISNTNTTQTYTNLTQTTQYRAVVLSGVCATANSSVATVTINGAAVGGTVAGSTTVCAGSNTGSVTLSGQSGTIVKWQFSVNGGGLWTDIANTTTVQTYTNLTQTTQYRAVISGCATTVNSGIATITMGSNALTVSITASDVTNDFCNGVTLTANSSAPVQSYLWSTSATTQTVKLGTGNAAGNYNVVVTGTNGCTGSATYNYDPQAMSSSYTILGTSSVSLARNNNVQSGSIGVTGSNGSITIAQVTSVASAGAFVKAINLNINATANVPVRYNAPAVVTLPTMQYNTSNTSALSNISVADNSTGTLNGNYRNVTIGANCNITLTGNVFGLITIKSSSKVRFTQAVVNVAGVNFKVGTAAAPTTLAFSQNTTVRSTGDFNLNPGCAINPEGYKVVIYLGVSGNNSNVDFKVASGGNTRINASIYSPNGSIIVGGNINNDTYLTGKYVAVNVSSTGQRVIWNSYDCSSPALITRADIGNSQIITPTVDNGPSWMKVSVTPMPTESFFTLRVSSTSKEDVKIKIYDVVGRQIEQFSGTVDQSFRFGAMYMQGTYIVEVHQGNNVKVLQIVKI